MSRLRCLREADRLAGCKPAALLAVLAVLLTTPAAVAQSILKADNTTVLNEASSWVGGAVPGSGNVAVWDSTVTSANTVGLGGDLSWQGIRVIDPAGNVTISSGNTLALGSGGIDLLAATTDLTIGADIALTATQSWRAAAGRTITLSGVIAGSSALNIGAELMTTNTFLTTTAQPLFPNASLSGLTGAAGLMGGASVNSGVPVLGLGYLLSNDGSNANYWLQVLDGGFTKAVKIELAQSGSDITARAADAKYVSGSQLGFDFNTGGIQNTVATSPTAAGYGAASTTLIFGSGSGTVRLAGVNNFTGPITVANGILQAGTASVAGVGGAFGLDAAVTLWDAAGTGIDLAGFDTRIGSLAGGGASGGGVALGGGTLTVGGTNTSTTYSGAISGGSLAKIGTGTLTLNRAGGGGQTLAGVEVTAGTLALTSASVGFKAGYFTGSTPITVRPGGRLAVGQLWNIGASNDVTIDGGTLAFTTSGGDGPNYVNLLTLENGASVTGDWRTGDQAAGSLVSRGNVTNTISGTLRLVNQSGGGSTWTATVADGTQAIDLNVSGVIADLSGRAAMAFVKAGDGTMRLAGANTFTGPTTLRAGELLLDYATQNNSKLSNTGVLTLGAGTLTLAGGSHAEVVASTTLVGAATVSRSSGTSVLQMGTVTNAGGSVDFSADGVATVANLNTNGILGGWATVGGTAWATNSTDAAGGPIGTYTAYTDVPFAGSITDDGATNVRLTGGTSGDITLAAATTTINSLQQGQASATVIDTAGQTLRLGSGGLFVPAASGSLSIGATAGSGTITAGSAADTAGTLTLIANEPASPVTFNAVVADNGTGAVGLTKSGPGTLVFAAAPTYTGATAVVTGTLDLAAAADFTLAGALSGGGDLVKSGTGRTTLSAAGTLSGTVAINAGTLAMGNNTSLGTAAVTLNGGTLERDAGNVTVTNAIDVAAGGGTLFGRQTVDAYTNFTGRLTGSGALTADGLVQLSGTGGTYSGTITLADRNTYLRFTSNTAVAATTSITTSTASRLRVDGGYSVQIAALNGDAELFATNDIGPTARLTVNAGTFGGTFSNGNGQFIFEKAGADTLTLNRTSTAGVIAGIEVTGGTLVLAGTGRSFNGTGYFGGAQPITVATGATLRVANDFNTNRTLITVDGGTLDVTAGSSANDGNNYIPSLTLRNGATVTGNALRGGFLSNTVVTVAGTSASTIATNFALVNGSGFTLTFDVADVTADAATDLTLTGGIRSVSFNGAPVVKSGSGAMVISGASDISGPVTIAAGAVTLGNGTALGTGGVTLTSEATGTSDVSLLLDSQATVGNAITVANNGTGTAMIGTTDSTTGSNRVFSGLVTLARDVTLQAGSSDRTTFTGQLTGTGDVTITSPFAADRRIVFERTGGSPNDFLGDVAIAAGARLQLGVANSIGDRTIPDTSTISFADAGSALRLAPTGSGDVETIGSLVSLAAGAGQVDMITGTAFTLRIGGDGGTGDFSGAITDSSGSLMLEKIGTGTQTFAAASTYSGGTTISAGTLVAGNANAFGTTGAISVGASGTLGVGDGVTFTRPFSLTAGGRVRTGNNSTVALPSVAALAAWESQSGSGDQTLAEILAAPAGSTIPAALTSAWTANPGEYLSDILTLEGTGAGNTYVLSMEYAAAFDNLNIWYRANAGDPFAPLGTSFVGNVPWSSSFTTVGQYGVDSSAGTVWAVTDHNSQFVVVPEPGMLGLAAAGLSGGIWYLRRQRAIRRP